MEQEIIFDLTHSHINLMRNALVIWDNSESGAPIIALYGENKKEAEILKDVAQMSDIRGNPDFSKEQTEKINKILSEMGTVLEIFLSFGKLLTGKYQYENKLLKVFKKRRKKYFKWLINSYSKKTARTQGDTVVFDIKEEHIKLLQNANCGWLGYWGVPGINSKRPYGDMTCFYLDMVDILKLPFKRRNSEYCDETFTKEQFAMLDELHESMIYALQVFLKYAKIEEGRFYKKGYDFWRK
ncbi:MAG: hypothetical protein K8R54_19570 [Bacteroidales bacterium]|nr:hypothetical protein [Bacteroidales bacterium]